MVFKYSGTDASNVCVYIWREKLSSVVLKLLSLFLCYAIINDSGRFWFFGNKQKFKMPKAISVTSCIHPNFHKTLIITHYFTAISFINTLPISQLSQTLYLSCRHKQPIHALSSCFCVYIASTKAIKHTHSSFSKPFSHPQVTFLFAHPANQLRIHTQLLCVPFMHLS